jgi:hypothetical protein
MIWIQLLFLFSPAVSSLSPRQANQTSPVVDLEYAQYRGIYDAKLESVYTHPPKSPLTLPKA